MIFKQGFVLQTRNKEKKYILRSHSLIQPFFSPSTEQLNNVDLLYQKQTFTGE